MITIDRIVSSVLIKNRLPMHWYLEVLTYACECVRELGFDVTGKIIPTIIDIDEFGVGKLPDGFVDHIKIGIPNNQYVIPLVRRPGLTRLNNYDPQSGDQIAYGDASDTIENRLVGSWLYYDNVNYNGENIGRLYGLTSANIPDGFVIVKERGEIRIDERLGATKIYLEYITDGQEVDNATKVEPYAQACIEAYCEWKIKANSGTDKRLDIAQSKVLYDQALLNLRGRMNPLTLEDIKRSARKAPNLRT